MAKKSPKQTRAEKSAETRKRVLDATSQAIRVHGTDGVSVSEIMKSVSLTHGTFYAHFSSKEDLMAAAVTHAADTFREALKEKAKTVESGGRARGLAAAYLTAEHATNPENGCFIAALGSELGRAPEPVGVSFRESVDETIAMIEGLLAADGSNRRDAAIASLATVVGGVILARAAKDDEARDTVLRACREALANRNGRIQ